MPFFMDSSRSCVVGHLFVTIRTDQNAIDDGILRHRSSNRRLAFYSSAFHTELARGRRKNRNPRVSYDFSPLPARFPKDRLTCRELLTVRLCAHSGDGSDSSAQSRIITGESSVARGFPRSAKISGISSTRQSRCSDPDRNLDVPISEPSVPERFHESWPNFPS